MCSDGADLHLAVLRLGHLGLPRDSYRGHYVYPPDTVHVTVTNLDDATSPLDAAIAELTAADLRAPTFTITGLGCSPDTVFLRCIHDGAFALLRAEVRHAFGVAGSPRRAGWVFERLSFANVIRFDGSARWTRVPTPRTTVTCTELEIVRTDRFLSERGTTVLARLALIH